MVVLVLVPFVASAVRAHHVGWLPSGDDALIGLRTHDVLTSERPELGQPSTSHLYGHDAGTSHPGPIEFYWLAAPLRLLGPSVGMISGILVVNLASVLVAAWVVLRRAGPAVAGWAMVLLSALLWSEGTAILTDPISSNAGGIPLIALAVLAWAVVDGDIRLLPLGAVFGSWVAQQHLSISLPAGAMVLYAAIGVAVGAFQRRRRGRARDLAATDPDAVPVTREVWSTSQERPAGFVDPDARQEPRIWPWVVGALAVCVVLWLPVIKQQLSARNPNLTAIIEYAQNSDTPSVGWDAAFRQAARATGFPPLLLRSDLTGPSFIGGPLTAIEVVTSVATYLLLVATAITQWRRRRTLALLAVTTLVLAAAGTYNGTTIPESVEMFRINFYRWTFVVAFLAWIVVGWVGALAFRYLVERSGREVPAVLPRIAPALAVAVMLIPALGTVATAGDNDERRDQTGFAAMRAMSTAAVAEADRAGADEVMLVLRGRSAVLASGPAVALQLEEAGHRVIVPDAEARFWGDERIAKPGGDTGDLILVLQSARGPGPAGPGRTIATFDMNEELRPLLAPLVAQAEGADPLPSDQAEALLAENFRKPVIPYVRGVMESLGDDPEMVLSDATRLQMVADGYYEAPVFDPDDVEAVLAELPARTVNDEDVFELRVLTPAELAEMDPRWAVG